MSSGEWRNGRRAGLRSRCPVRGVRVRPPPCPQALGSAVPRSPRARVPVPPATVLPNAPPGQRARNRTNDEAGRSASQENAHPPSIHRNIARLALETQFPLDGPGLAVEIFVECTKSRTDGPDLVRWAKTGRSPERGGRSGRRGGTGRAGGTGADRAGGRSGCGGPARMRRVVGGCARRGRMRPVVGECGASRADEARRRRVRADEARPARMRRVVGG
jgi:hypothetical protein